MLSLRERPSVDISIESAAARLTETILGNDDHDLAETLRTIASEIGLAHIAYLRLSPDKSPDICLLVAVVTYSRLWQHRYFVKKYMSTDPVIFYGRQADQPFDWTNLPVDEPAAKAFFADAFNHSVGRNGLSIPLRNRRGVFALVSFSSDLSNDEWGATKPPIWRSSNFCPFLLIRRRISISNCPPFRSICRIEKSSVCFGRRAARLTRRLRRSWVWRLAASKRIWTRPATSCTA